MSNLYNVIADLCKEKGIKGAKMCTDTGISKGLLTDLKMGRRSGVSAATAQKIASYFGVSVGYLLGEEEKEEKPHTQSFSPETMKLVERLSKLSPDKMEQAIQYIEFLANQNK